MSCKGSVRSTLDVLRKGTISIKRTCVPLLRT